MIKQLLINNFSLLYYFNKHIWKSKWDFLVRFHIWILVFKEICFPWNTCFPLLFIKFQIQKCSLLRRLILHPRKNQLFVRKKPIATWHISLMLPKSWDIKGIAPQLNETSLSKLRRMHTTMCRLILWIWENLRLVSFHLMTFSKLIFQVIFFPASPVFPQRIPVKRSNLWKHIKQNLLFRFQLSLTQQQ